MTSLAGDHPLLEVDHDSRARIRDDLHRNLFVEAGAGTGKTRVLVDRVVRLVATGTVREIGNLVAITFTEAAAAELRDRVRRALEVAAIDPRSAAARTRAVRLRSRATRRGDDHDAARLRPPHPGRVPARRGLCRLRSRSRTRCRRGFGSTSGGSGSATTSSPTPTTAATCCSPRRCGLSPDSTRDLARLLHARWDRLVGVDFPLPPLPDSRCHTHRRCRRQGRRGRGGPNCARRRSARRDRRAVGGSPCPARRRARGGRRVRGRPGARRRPGSPSRDGGDERRCGATPSPPRSRR